MIWVFWTRCRACLHSEKIESLVAENSARSVCCFGSFEFDPETGELRKQEIRIRLEGQPVAILATLLQRPGALVTRDELQKKLWRGETFVDFEQSLNAAVRRLRLALDDSAESPRYIETIARRGYRWVAPVRNTDVGPSIEAAAKPSQSKVRSRWERRTAWVAAAVVALSAAIFFTVNRLRAPLNSTKVMLAVLPFENLSESVREEYVADGMTDEMITQLGGLDPQHLGVIARTSAMRYKGVPKDVAQVARELRVNYLLEGSIRRQGQRVRVTAHLIQASDQTDLWSESYDRDISDILKLQNEVAGAIANQIRGRLPREAERRLSSAPRLNAEAYEAYLNAQQGWNLRSKEGLQRAIKEFQHAVAIDRNYAAAFAGLARAYALSSVYRVLPELNAMPKAREAAVRAIALDDSLADVHTMLGFIKAHYEYN
jgi:TolB-like protein/DNA-binding winged helix-turn-helix (wHTH) protein